MPKDPKVTAVNLYREGATLDAITKATGLHAQTIVRAALAAGLSAPAERIAEDRERRAENVVAAYNEGQSPAQIADAQGLGLRTVQRYLNEAGLMATRTHSRDDLIRSMHTNGHTNQAIADHLGIDSMTVTRVLEIDPTETTE